MRVHASAPGKTILMGEHAAVYGRPALVAAVDRRLYATLTETRGTEIQLELPEVGVSESVGWDEIRAYARTARARWTEYEQQPGPEAFDRLRGDDPAHLVKVALGEALDLTAGEAPGARLRLRSEIPIGAGFGSSAAAATVIACSVLRYRGAEAGTGALERLGLEIERRQHGTPSGIDTATVIHGGVVWARRDATGDVVAEPVTVRATHLCDIRVFNSGTPAESTGAVVAAVRARRDADRQGFEQQLDRMESATRELRRLLESASSARDRLITPMRAFQACLEEIGVVPPRLREIVRGVESRGGAAKISGAGALTGSGAGSLLVYHPDPGIIDGWRFLDSLERLDVRLGAEGIRAEVG